MTKKRAAVLSYGCQMNDYDSDRFRGILIRSGYELDDRLEECDLILVNTCAVRAKAEQRVIGRLAALQRYRQARPHLVLGVAGCVARLRGAALLKNANVVIYPEAVEELAGVLASLHGKSRVVLDGTAGAAADAGRAPAAYGVHAYTTVMTGCSNYCSYCIVPYVRGPERSRRAAEILTEVRDLASHGVREVTLLGQNVNTYGSDLADAPGFPALLAQVAAVEGIARIRFVTSHPRDFSRALVDAMAAIPEVMPSLHLPVQSGSDRVLRAMGRGYTCRQYEELVATLRERLPELALSSDFIVGFPGETEEDFQATVALVRRVGYAQAFVFKYSARPGTRAAELPGRLATDFLAARHRRLLAAVDEEMRAQAASQAGRTVEMLVEKSDDDTVSGRSRDNHGVVAAGTAAVGSLARAVVETVRGRVLRGRLVTA